MIRLAIFEDNAHMRKSMVTLFHSSEEITVCGVFSDCNELLRNLRESVPDVVLMDIRMPGKSGIDAVKELKKHYPKVSVVMQTIFDSDDKIFAAICAGANGYILKGSSPETYTHAVEDAYHGGAPMTPYVAAKVLSMFKKQTENKPAVDYALSEKESEVLRALVAGKSYKMIAADMNVSYPTVRFHMKNIYEKLQVGSMTEVVAKAIKEKIIL